MPAWRTPELEPEWIACEQGLDEARDRARRFREDAPELGGFEGLIWAVEQLMAPLDAFADGRGALPRARRPLRAGLPGERPRDSLPR